MTGWIVLAGIWLDYEVEGPYVMENVSSYCPQATLVTNVGEDVSGGKNAISWMLVVAYLAYTGLAVYGIVMAKKKARKGIEIKESGESQHSCTLSNPRSRWMGDY